MSVEGGATTEAPRRYGRSVSQVQDLQKCGHLFLLKRIQKAPETPSLYLAGGVAAHATADRIDKYIIEHNALPSEEIVRKGWGLELEAALVEGLDREADTDKWQRSSARGQGKPNGEDLEWWAFKGGPEMVLSYLAWRDAKRWPVALIDGKPAIEIDFEIDIDGLPVRGKIDRVYLVDGQLVLVDLKTSSRVPEEPLQLETYRSALQRMWSHPVEWGGYFMFRTGNIAGPKPLSWSDEMVDAVYVDSDKQIAAGAFPAHPGKHCRQCGVKQWCIYQGGTPYVKEKEST